MGVKNRIAKYKIGDIVHFDDFAGKDTTMIIKDISYANNRISYSDDFYCIDEDEIKGILDDNSASKINFVNSKVNFVEPTPNEILANSIAKKSDFYEEDKPFLYETLLDFAKEKDKRPILEQGGWHKEEPTKDCFVLLMTEKFPKNCFYIIAEWDNDAQCFYSEETDEPIEKWDYWKELEENLLLKRKNYKEELEYRKKIENYEKEN